MQQAPRRTLARIAGVVITRLVRAVERRARAVLGLPPTYFGCPEHCGRLEAPGLAADRADLVDFSTMSTTADQARIEQALKALPWEGCSVLHVGVGNSGFAAAFAGGLRRVDGVTISVNERRHAEELALANYRVMLVSKYGRDLAPLLSEKYDFIIDNNLAGFACCKFHFHQMLDTYCWALKPGGRVLTDEEGMSWAFRDSRWKLTFRELAWLAKLLPLEASKLTDRVYALERIPARRAKSVEMR